MDVFGIEFLKSIVPNLISSNVYGELYLESTQAKACKIEKKKGSKWFGEVVFSFVLMAKINMWCWLIKCQVWHVGSILAKAALGHLMRWRREIGWILGDQDLSSACFFAC